MGSFLIRGRWQQQPHLFRTIDFSHRLAWGFDNPRAFFYVFNPTFSCTVGNSSFQTFSYDAANSYLGQTAGASAMKIVTNQQGYGLLIPNAAASEGMSTLVLIDSAISDHGTIYWGQQPTDAFNAGTVKEMWGCRTGGGTPEFSAQRFSDNNLYIGWNGASDDRITIANTAAWWSAGQINNWAFTWKNGAKSQLFNNGALIGTAGTNNAVSNFSGGNTFNIGVASGSANFQGQLLYFGLTGQVHTLDMIEDMAANPYQIFARRRRTYFFTPTTTVVSGPGNFYQPWIKPGVGPNPARVGREFAFLGSQTIVSTGGSFSGTTIAGNKPLTGQVATLAFQRNFATIFGNKPLSGQVSALTFQRNLSTIAGSLVKTGQVSSLLQGNVFTSVAGNKPLTGQVASLAFQRNFTTIAGNKPLNGGVGTLAFQRNFGTIAGTLTKTGGVATLSIPFAGTTVPGGLVKTGQVANLTVANPPTGTNFHQWHVKAIGVKTKISVNSQVDGDIGDTP